MIHKDVLKVLYTQEQINERCKELGKQISDEYVENGKLPLVVGLLRGSVPFMAELIKYITVDLEIDFMDVSSYEGTETTGDVKIIKDLDSSVRGRAILVVEDIVDTGLTVSKIKAFLLAKGASDVKIAALFNKPERREIDIDADYCGFNIPNEFVIGFGLDYNQKYRNLPYVGVLKPEVYENKE